MESPKTLQSRSHEAWSTLVKGFKLWPGRTGSPDRVSSSKTSLITQPILSPKNTNTACAVSPQSYGTCALHLWNGRINIDPACIAQHHTSPQTSTLKHATHEGTSIRIGTDQFCVCVSVCVCNGVSRKRETKKATKSCPSPRRVVAN